MLFKLIAEKKYTQDCFAYVPGDNPDKWSLQIKEYNGDAVELNKDLLIEAAESFGPDSKVQIHASDIGGVKTAIRAGFRELGISDIPGSIMESIDINCEADVFDIKSFAEAQINKTTGVIKNVVFITRESKNNRSYMDQALDDIVRLAEGGKLYANHPTKSQLKDTGGVRDVREMIGKSFNLRREGQKVIGDAQILSSHSHWIMPIAEQMPELAGFSWTGGGKGHRQGSKEMVEAISRHNSLDLVSEPAATKNLFESLDLNKEGEVDGMKWNEITEAVIKDKAPELYKAIQAQVKENGAMPKEYQEKIDLVIKENKELKDEVGTLKTESVISKSKSVVDEHLNKFISENKLDETVVADLRVSLVGKEEAAIKEAVTARATMLKDTGILKNVKGMGAEFKQESNSGEVSDEDIQSAM